MQNHVARIGCAIAPVGNKTGIVGGEALTSTITMTPTSRLFLRSAPIDEGQHDRETGKRSRLRNRRALTRDARSLISHRRQSPKPRRLQAEFAWRLSDSDGIRSGLLAFCFDLFASGEPVSSSIENVTAVSLAEHARLESCRP
jgi:hypothetical protein